ncbi:hypothetical protein [Stigmatella aurantiaca]|nr:hypothetical protein [Stigmatella aurantiaca]
MLCGVVSGLLLLVLPLEGKAQGQNAAQAHIDAARRFYEELEYERAMEELHRAQRRARTQDEFSSILLHEGVILAELGRAEEAAAAFQASLNLRPGATLPLVVSPKIQKQFEAARQEAQRDLARVTPAPPPAPAEDKLEPSPAWVASPPSAPVQAPPALASTVPAPASAAPVPISTPPASAVAAVPQQPKGIERNALARRLADFEARLREPREPAIPAAAGAQLRDLRTELGAARSVQTRSSVAVKLDRWESRYFPPADPSAPVVVAPPQRAAPLPSSSAPVRPPPSYGQSLDREALARRIKDCEAWLRQNNDAATSPGLLQLKDIRYQLSQALTPQMRISVAVNLDRWERRFLPAP